MPDADPSRHVLFMRLFLASEREPLRYIIATIPDVTDARDVLPAQADYDRLKRFDTDAWLRLTRAHRTIYLPVLLGYVLDDWSVFDYPDADLVTGNAPPHGGRIRDDRARADCVRRPGGVKPGGKQQGDPVANLVDTHLTPAQQRIQFDLLQRMNVRQRRPTISIGENGRARRRPLGRQADGATGPQDPNQPVRSRRGPGSPMTTRYCIFSTPSTSR